tara:strand:+ start:197 stop:376 length:180 start_codon:yes stop_codon:yes gene_type:complete
MDFYQTKMGHQYYNYTLPQLIAELKRIATALEKHASTQEEASKNNKAPNLIFNDSDHQQ